MVTYYSYRAPGVKRTPEIYMAETTARGARDTVYECFFRTARW